MLCLGCPRMVQQVEERSTALERAGQLLGVRMKLPARTGWLLLQIPNNRTNNLGRAAGYILGLLLRWRSKGYFELLLVLFGISIVTWGSWDVKWTGL